jgi:hypothetical protein
MRLENTEYNGRPGNGKAGPHIYTGSLRGLANTIPEATRGSTLGPGAASGEPGSGSRARQEIAGSAERVYAVQADYSGRLMPAQADFSGEGRMIADATVLPGVRTPRPAGQVVLFQKIMQDWNFSDHEAATLLGLETESDLDDICVGTRPVGHRDANDRLGSVLRMAADLDALFQEETAIRDWLDERQSDLNEETPRSLLTEGSMENLLRVKYYVAYLSGR